MNRKNLIKNVKGYILSLNIFELTDLAVGKVAEKFEVNVCFLSRKFKESSNMVLSEYIDFVKISQSLHLIKTRGDLEIEEIARVIGIKKKQTFREKFKKYFGLNPLDFRSLYKTNNKQHYYIN